MNNNKIKDEKQSLNTVYLAEMFLDGSCGYSILWTGHIVGIRLHFI